MNISLPKQYMFIRFLNGGYHGNVYLVLKNKKYYVLKQIIDLEGGINELVALQHLNHKNIIKLNEYFVYDNKIFFEFNYYGNGSLLNRILKNIISPYEAKKWKKQLKLAIKYCYKNNWSHNDIKLDNIMIDDDHNIILIDFGCSMKMSSTEDIKNIKKINKIINKNTINSRI